MDDLQYDRVRPAAGAERSSATRRRAARPRWPPTTRSGRSCPRTSPRSAATCRSCSTRAGNRLAAARDPARPQVAATDGGNTTFFVADAAARRRQPAELLRHERRGAARRGDRGAGRCRRAAGRARCRPTAMRALLQAQRLPARPRPLRTARRRRGGLTITADGTQGDERRDRDPAHETAGLDERPAVLPRPVLGPGLDRVAHARRRGRGTRPGLGAAVDRSARASCSTRGRSSRLPVFGGPDLFEQGFPFTVGAASPGHRPGRVTAQFARPGVGHANRQQFQA